MEKRYYKIGVYSDTDKSLYKYSAEGDAPKITLDYLQKIYFDKPNNRHSILRFFKKKNNDTVCVYDDIVNQLIDYHKQEGTNNYVKALSEHIFHNKIYMMFDDLRGVEDSFPWNHNDSLYNMFLSDPIVASSQIIFVAEDQLDNSNTFSESDYQLFFEDVKALLNLCQECAIEFQRSLEYNDLVHSDENRADYKWSETVSIHLGKDNDLKIVDLGQVKDYIENTMFDDNYYNEHEYSMAKDSSIIIQKKKGSTYVVDPNANTIDVYISDPGSYKYKS